MYKPIKRMFTMTESEEYKMTQSAIGQQRNRRKE